jgi:hypothetical protein
MGELEAEFWHITILVTFVVGEPTPRYKLAEASAIITVCPGFEVGEPIVTGPAVDPVATLTAPENNPKFIAWLDGLGGSTSTPMLTNPAKGLVATYTPPDVEVPTAINCVEGEPFSTPMLTGPAVGPEPTKIEAPLIVTDWVDGVPVVPIVTGPAVGPVATVVLGEKVPRFKLVE